MSRQSSGIKKRGVVPGVPGSSTASMSTAPPQEMTSSSCKQSSQTGSAVF